MQRCSVSLLIVVVCAAFHMAPAWPDTPPASQLAGLALKALSDADLDAIEAKVGHRVGVLVAAVTDGSPAATTGLCVGDVLFIVGESGVDSPEAVDTALTGKVGPVKVAAMRPKADGTGEIVEVTLTMPEPTASPAAPVATGGGSNADTDAKLKALDTALANGVLTQEEYDRKKAELLAQAKPPALDQETQDKLKALDAARQAGVISEAEYQQKRTALLGGSGETQVGDGAPLYSDPQGRFRLRCPQGWEPKLRADQNGVDLVKGGMTGSVLALQGQGTSDDLLNGLLGPIREQTKEFAEVGRGQVAIGPGTGPSVEYTGVDPEGARRHMLLAASAGEGMGFVFMLVAPPEDFAPARPEWEATLRSFSRGGTPTAGATAPPAGTTDDPVTVYFDMFDFMRSQAWGNPVKTSPEDRQRLLAMLDQAGPETSGQLLQALQPVPQAWAELQTKWNEATEDKKAQQRENWRNQLLLPTFLFPPPVQAETFRGRNDRVVFEYPAGWVIAEAEDEGTQYLYLGPPGTQTDWQQVLDPVSSPPGAFLAIMPIPDELKGVDTFADGARLLAQQYVLPPGADFREINVADVGEGAIVTFRGRYPGEAEDRFYWVGAVRYGPDSILAGRLGGPISQADALVPAFACMVMTMELNPPSGGGGGDYGSAMVDYYAARAGNIAVSGGW